MSIIDWIVLLGSLAFIVSYGVYKGKGNKDLKGYLMADRNIKWQVVGISVMATQASAITFLSTPGLAFTDGMRFIQFYFGLPLAMVVISATIIPIYHKLKVYTAYEYLESRFDLKTRVLAALLFLIQRGFAAGITIYAPAIILSTLLGWNIYITNIVIGVLVIIYTAAGGSKAVSWTQTQQMFIILLAMSGAFILIINMLPDNIGFTDALFVAGKMGKLNVIDFTFDMDNRYNLWSGLIGGFFLSLSYFGTDQSQVQRYLVAKSATHSRLGLLMNGVAKIPMQFFILLLGVMLFVFYQFDSQPLFFNSVAAKSVRQGKLGNEYKKLEKSFAQENKKQSELIKRLISAKNNKNEISVDELSKKVLESDKYIKTIKTEGRSIIREHFNNKNMGDTNFIFLSFVLKYIPIGFLGLIIAAIIAASMSSTSSELNALAATTMVDLYKRNFKKKESDMHYMRVSKLLTVGWGVFAIIFAQFANQLGALIEAVNILGSLFYGTILGIFLVAFYVKRIKGTATFYAAIITELIIIAIFLFVNISYLWLNLIGCFLVYIFSSVINFYLQKKYI